MKILMVLMGLEIGGAETHVVELSKELKRRGHEIVVASSGGVYEKELTDCGIIHVNLPLASRSPHSVLKSLFGLKKLIKRENFDIVHAHARIPGFICGILAKKMGFKFITTAHFDFKVTSFYRKTTNWGEYQLAVSQDLKNYLIQNYGEIPDNIKVTINGIDTEKFSGGRDVSGIIDEFSLNPSAKHVLYVGRIDREVARAALLLAENAHRIADAYPGTEIIIVGGGSAFEELEELAEKSNIIAGYKCVTLAGARTDIADFTSLCDIFTGVSRAALEAMAAGRPVVLAGAQGYMGIFDKSKLETAMANNFTCRGEAAADGEKLVNDICSLLGKSNDILSAMGKYNANVVDKYYSVSKMADDYLSVYGNCGTRLDKPADIIISGYYGFANLGDDTLLRCLISSLRKIKPDVKITVLCANRKKMSKLYGARTINRYNIPAIIREMKHAKILINGGGNLIQDGTSKKSLLYYTSIMKLAKINGLKTVLYANGIGPLYNQISRKRAKKAIDSSDLITLRDPESLGLIEELGCHEAAKNARVSADPAFCGLESDSRWIEFVMNREGFNPSDKYFMISVRSGNTLSKSGNESYDSRVVEETARAINAVSKKYSLTPVFVPFQNEIDDNITHRLASMCKRGKILKNLSAAELCGIIGICEFVISMRLHLLIFAASENVPVIGLSYDKKVNSFLNYIEQPYIADIRNFRSEDIVKMVDEIIENKENISQELKKKVSHFRALSQYDAESVISMLG